MVKQIVDSILFQSLITVTSLESLVKGYLLNYRTENKSPKTISDYEMVLRNSLWYAKANYFPDVQTKQLARAGYPRVQYMGVTTARAVTNPMELEKKKGLFGELFG